MVRGVTDKRCYAGLFCDKELQADELPDGNIITRAMLIRPSFIGQRIPRLFFPYGCEV